MNDKIKALSKKQMIKMIEILLETRNPVSCVNCFFFDTDCSDECFQGNENSLWEFDFALLEVKND